MLSQVLVMGVISWLKQTNFIQLFDFFINECGAPIDMHVCFIDVLKVPKQLFHCYMEKVLQTEFTLFKILQKG